MCVLQKTLIGGSFWSLDFINGKKRLEPNLDTDIYIAFLKGHHRHGQKSGENSLVASFSWVTMQKSKRSLIKNFYAISYTVGLYRCWSFLYVPLQTKVSFICRERRDKLKSVSHNDRWHTKKCLPNKYIQCLQVFD